ncbi:MAG: hypothetical protein ACYDBV_13350 [Nitrospiria bacterium]
MKLECLFCRSLQDIPLEMGFVCRCVCGSYGCICDQKELADLRIKVAGFLGFTSSLDVKCKYETIFSGNDPPIILWVKRTP